MRTKNVVLVSTVAALYVIFTIMLAPISFGPIQFRVSEVLKGLVLFNPVAALGIGLGTFIANLFSPYAGPWDLIWMPITDIVGGCMAYMLFIGLFDSKPIFPMIFYAITTGLAVGIMLHAFGLGPFWAVTLPVIASELIILLAGLPLMLQIGRTLGDRL